MSEFFLRKYRPIADALLAAHHLVVPDAARDMLADTITHCRELPEPADHRRSPRADLAKVRTHAAKLIEYADHPPVQASSIPLRRQKLAHALRSDSPLLALHLIYASAPFDPSRLLRDLDRDRTAAAELRRLLGTLDAIREDKEKQKAEAREQGKRAHGIGRPWAAHTYVIRAGCIAWHRAGREIGYRWHDDTGTLTGPLAAFLRDLITYCDKAAFCLFQEKPHRAPAGYDNPGPVSTPRGSRMSRHAPDSAIRDGIRAWKAWFAGVPAKNGTFFS